MAASAQTISEIAQKALAEPKTSARREVSAAEADAFSRRLQDESKVTAPVTAIEKDDNSASQSALPLGDTILNGLKHAGVEFENQWSGLKETVSDGKGPMTVTQLLHTQMKMFEIEYLAQFTAGMIKKTSTAIDQALHTQ